MKMFACLIAAGFACVPAVQAATITIVNNDGPGEGLNDLTPRLPEGGNNGVTLGQQRLIALQTAAAAWGSRLASNIEIKVRAEFNSLAPCDALSGVVGFAGPTSSFNFVGSPPAGAFANTFYPVSLSEALVQANQNGTNAEIQAQFNSDVDGPVCFGASSFWYGITPGAVPPGRLAIFQTVLHELGHGLGFVSFACTQAGGCGAGVGREFGAFNNSNNTPDIWGRFVASLPGGTLWTDLTNAQRAASMASDPNLVWTGPNVTAALPGLVAGTASGFMRLHAPNPTVQGSSISHFSADVSPNDIMEPSISSSIFINDPGRAVPLMRDIGWTLIAADPNLLFRNGFE